MEIVLIACQNLQASTLQEEMKMILQMDSVRNKMHVLCVYVVFLSL